MDRRPPLLARLRGTLLGAWLACAYGLAVLAGALSVGPAHGTALFADAVLCSGLAAPGQDEAPAEGEPSHCKGCPVNPVLAAPAAGAGFVALRVAVQADATDADDRGLPGPRRLGLPQSRAPPSA